MACFSASGPLDRLRLFKSARIIAESHSAFSTRFIPSDTIGESYAICDLPTQFDCIEIKDTGNLNTITEAVMTTASTRMDLEGGVLGRIVVGTVDEQTSVIGIAAEHIVCDGWALGLCVRQLGEVYCDGTHPKCSSIQDEALQQIAWLRSRAAADAKAFWDRQLNDVGSMVPFRLPGSCQSATVIAGETTSHSRILSLETMAHLRRIASSSRTTASALIIAAAASAARDIGADPDLSVIAPTLNRFSISDFRRVSWAANIVTFRFKGNSPRPIELPEAAAVYNTAMQYSRYPIHQIDLDLSPAVFGQINTSSPQLYVDPSIGTVRPVLKLPGITVEPILSGSSQVLLGFVIQLVQVSGHIEVWLSHRSSYVAPEIGQAMLDRVIARLYEQVS